MTELTEADTIRILVSTDNHVGYNERDPIRGDDSAKTFHEIMCLAKKRDVDMVLLAGDLFHENKPSRKAMYEVMRSMRENCYGEKPCELEMLSDAGEIFQGAFNHVNYEDPDINVAIPVFSIHGNHDDPSGEGHLAALDLLQVSGLVNYYGRTPESDNILVKPVLLQKGRTKLALYGMSNVRDERLFRTFRDGKVRFFQPAQQINDWFNLMSVHQNHHAHTETGYLPENFLPSFLDLVIWGHEHECLIEPRKNPDMGFYVMQPGSSVATALVPGETEPKHVAILSITGKQMKVEPIKLKTVRPFLMREIFLRDEKEAMKFANRQENRHEVTKFLNKIVTKLIEEANQEWLKSQAEQAADDDDDNDIQESLEPPLPIVRLRVEYTAPDGENFDVENPQRFSNRFVGRVANVNDVVQFYRKKTSNSRSSRDNPDMPEESAIAELTIDSIRVDKLVHEFLSAQSLTILPQNSFGDAVSQFVDKDDKHAMEMFVNESLSNQVKHLMAIDQADDDAIQFAMDENRTKMEELFAEGHLRIKRKEKIKPKPDHWDTDLDGEWEDQPGALIHTDEEAEKEEDLGSVRSTSATRGRGRGRGGRAAASTTLRRSTTAKARSPTKVTRGKKQIIEEDEEEEEADEEADEEEVEGEKFQQDDDEDIIMVNNSDESDKSSMFTKRSRTTRSSRTPLRGKGSRGGRRGAAAATATTSTRSTRSSTPAKRTAVTRQTKLSFASQATAAATPPPSQTRSSTRISARNQKSAVEDIEDDDDDFEPMISSSVRSSRSRRF